MKELDKSEELIQYVQDRPGHDRRYAIDNTKITAELGWRPAYTFEQGIHETIQWYLQNTGWLLPFIVPAPTKCSKNSAPGAAGTGGGE